MPETIYAPDTTGILGHPGSPLDQEDEDRVNGDQKTQLLSDLIHASVVTLVVAAVTTLSAMHVGIPQDVTGTVFGGAIGYAAGRAGLVAPRRSI
jgi:phosphate/sulfate permease